MDKQKQEKIEGLIELISQRDKHRLDALEDIEGYKRQISELEKEKSPAEEYAQAPGIDPNDWTGLNFDRKSLMYAHEAGQKVGSDREIKRCSDVFRDYLADINWKGIESAEIPDIFKSHVFNHKPEEKPEIVGELTSKHIDLEEDYQYISFKINRKHAILSKNYLLTPLD